MRIAVLQMTSGIDPAANARTIVEGIVAASDGGAAMLFTPEMSGLLDRDRARAAASLKPEADDPGAGRGSSKRCRTGYLGPYRIARGARG